MNATADPFLGLKSDGTAAGTTREVPAAAAGAERREVTFQQLREYAGGKSDTLAGIKISPDTALTLAAVFAAVNVLATDLSALPLGVYERSSGNARQLDPTHPVYDLVRLEPNEDSTAMRFRQALYGHVFTHGNGLAEIVRFRGSPVELQMLHPANTHPYRDADKKLWYRLDNGKSLPARDVLHIAGLGFDGIVGYSPIKLMKQSIALGLAAEAFGAAYFGNGTSPKGALKTPNKLSDDAWKHLRESWNGEHRGVENSHKPAILEEGLDWVSFSVPLEDAQFLETRQFQVVDIARIFRVPPHKIGDFSQAHLANVEAANLDYLTTVLAPWCEQVEQELNRKLLSKAERRTHFIEHNMSALLRGDSKSRAELYRSAIGNGWMTVDEVRGKENLQPVGDVAGGSKHLVPAALTTLQIIGTPQAPKPPATPPVPAEGEPEKAP